MNFNRNFIGLLYSIKPYINHRSFKRNFRIYIFDTRYQKNHIRAQAMQLNFKFVRGVADIICHALVLTKKNISFNSDGSKMVDIVS